MTAELRMDSQPQNVTQSLQLCKAPSSPSIRDGWKCCHKLLQSSAAQDGLSSLWNDSGKPLPCLLQSLVFWKRLQDCSGCCGCDLRCLSCYFSGWEDSAAWLRGQQRMFPVSVKCSPGACVSQSAQMEMDNKIHDTRTQVPEKKCWNC